MRLCPISSKSLFVESQKQGNIFTEVHSFANMHRCHYCFSISFSPNEILGVRLLGDYLSRGRPTNKRANEQKNPYEAKDAIVYQLISDYNTHSTLAMP